MQEINGSLNTGPNIVSDPLYHTSAEEYANWLSKLNLGDLQKHYVMKANQAPQGDRKSLETKLKRLFSK